MKKNTIYAIIGIAVLLGVMGYFGINSLNVSDVTEISEDLLPQSFAVEPISPCHGVHVSSGSTWYYDRIYTGQCIPRVVGNQIKIVQEGCSATYCFAGGATGSPSYNYVGEVLQDCGVMGVKSIVIDNGTEYLSCNTNCIPDKKVCVQTADGYYESQQCDDVGVEITQEVCPGACVDGACVSVDIASLPLIIERENSYYTRGKPIEFSLDTNYPIESEVVVETFILYPDCDGSDKYYKRCFSAEEENWKYASIYTNTLLTDDRGNLDLSFTPNLNGNEEKVLVKLSTTTKGVARVKYATFIGREPNIIFDNIGPTSFEWDDSIVLNFQITDDSYPVIAATVGGKVVDEYGNILSEDLQVTDSDGKVNLDFGKLMTDGDFKVQVTYQVTGSSTKTEEISIKLNPIAIDFDITEYEQRLREGEDISVTAYLAVSDEPFKDAIVYGKIKQNSNVLSETYAFVDKDGYVDFSFPPIEGTGSAILELTADILGNNKITTKSVYIEQALPVTLSIKRTEGDLDVGSDITIPVDVKLGADILSGVSVRVDLKRGDSIIKSALGTTDSTGRANIEFLNVDVAGDINVEAKVRYGGVDYTATSKLYFEGVPITMSSSTKALTQYNLEPIVFYVEIDDIYGTGVSEERLDYMEVISSLTKGTIRNSTIEYIGSGEYKISTNVLGIGTFSGYLNIDYEGTLFNSIPISIEVLSPSLDIDTSSIAASVDYGANKTYTFKVVSSLGGVINADNVWIEVTHPSAFEKEIISNDDILRVGEGEYMFDFNNFNEIEKYSFDIYAEKEGFELGNAKASVAVAGDSNVAAGSDAIGFLVQYKWLILSVVIILIIFVLIRRMKKNGK